jgi:hypothetical protein
VPLAVVGTNAVYNGVYLAVQILGVKDHRVRSQLAELRAGLAAGAGERAEAVQAYARGLQVEYPQPAAAERTGVLTPAPLLLLTAPSPSP